MVSFEPGAYNDEASIGENLLFGTATGKDPLPDPISPYFASILARNGLARDLFATGHEIARNAIELFGDLPPDHPFFQQLSFMSADDLPLFQALVNKLRPDDFDAAKPDERASIIRLSFAYIEPRHRFGLLTDELKAKIVEARHDFHRDMPEELRGSIEMYDPTRYAPSASMIDNVLFGRISINHADGAEQIQAVVRELMQSEGLYERVVSVGLEFHVGSGGKRLTSVQRQKLNLARALIRRSDFYVFNRPLAGLDQKTQEVILHNAIELLCRDGRQPTIVWVLSNAAHASLFDRILVFSEGFVVEDGSHQKLSDADGKFRELMSA